MSNQKSYLRSATPSLLYNVEKYGNTYRWIGLYFDGSGKSLMLLSNTSSFPPTREFARLTYTYGYTFDITQDIQQQIDGILNS